MIKKTALLSISAIIILFGCSKAKDEYSDIKRVMRDGITINTSFADSMEKAKNGKDVAAAIDNYTAGMKKLVPMMKNMDMKYKSMNLKNPEKAPAELKSLVKDNNKVTKRMIKALSGLVEYANDPDVRKAQEKFQKVMAALR